MSTATKYTFLNLPNSFTVCGTEVSDTPTRTLINGMQNAYNTFGGEGLMKQVNKIIQKVRHAEIWNGGTDKNAIISLWKSVNWGQLNVTQRTALFAVTNGIS
jgi:hypothetical protein